jgi:hypothetical protein
MSTELHELDIPDGVFEAEGPAIEFVRFWVAGGEDHVTLKIGSFDSTEEAGNWGMVLADLAKHAVRGMQQDDPSRGTPEQMLAEIQKAFFARLEHTSANLTGQLKVDKQ